MVNLTAIKRISQFISSSNIRPMKKWSERYRLDSQNNKSPYLKLIISQVKVLLRIVSGNDIVEMLKGSCINYSLCFPISIKFIKLIHNFFFLHYC